VRFAATYALMRLPSSTTAVELIAMLQDRDPEIRANAARGLGAAKAAPNALDPVAEDPDWRVRGERIRALGGVGKAALEDVHHVVSRLETAANREFVRFKEGGTTSLHVLLEIVAAASEIGAEGLRVVQLLEKSPWKSENMAPALAPDLARLGCAIAFA